MLPEWFVPPLEGADAQAVQKNLRRHGIGGKPSKQSQRRAPALRHPNTDLVLVGLEELDEAWLEFFGSMEYGTCVSIDELARCCAAAPPPELLAAKPGCGAKASRN